MEKKTLYKNKLLLIVYWLNEGLCHHDFFFNKNKFQLEKNSFEKFISLIITQWTKLPYQK